MSTGFGVRVVALIFGAVAVIGNTTSAAAQTLDRVEYKLQMGMIVINANSIFQANSSDERGEIPELASKFLLTVTAYSSSVDETDSTPFVTASGTKTRDGVIASNLFPFGTQVKIPEFFGDQFTHLLLSLHSDRHPRPDGVSIRPSSPQPDGEPVALPLEFVLEQSVAVRRGGYGDVEHAAVPEVG